MLAPYNDRVDRGHGEHRAQSETGLQDTGGGGTIESRKDTQTLKS